MQPSIPTRAPLDCTASTAPNTRMRFAICSLSTLTFPRSCLPTIRARDSTTLRTLLDVSPALLESYVGAATKISRLAVGDPSISPSTETWRAPGDLSQTTHIEGLPIGTRGGILIDYTFPLDAEYAFKIRTRSAGFGVGSGALPIPIEITLDGARREPGQEPDQFSPQSHRRARIRSALRCPQTIPRGRRRLLPYIPTTPQLQAWRSPDRRIPPGRVTRPAAGRSSFAILLPITKPPAPNEF